MEARAELFKSMPPEPEAPKVNRASVIAGLTPTTADQIAVQARELAIVDRLIASGRTLAEVMRGASPERLAAIAANAEVMPEVLRSDDPAAVVAGIHERVFDALVEAGHPQAVIARDAQAQFDEQSAWREVIKDTIEARQTGAGLSALHRADKEGFDALMAANTDPVRDSDTGERIRQLDRVFGIGMATAGVWHDGNHRGGGFGPRQGAKPEPRRPEVEEEVMRLIREGRSRREACAETGLSARVATRIAKDSGVEWARVGSGSNGTPEAMAKARRVQSQYAPIEAPPEQGTFEE